MASKPARILFFLLTVCLLLSSCSKPEEPSSSAPSPSSSEPPPVSSEAPPAEPDPPVGGLDPTPIVESIGGVYSIYTYHPETKTYTYEELPASRRLSVLDMIRRASEPFGLEPLLINFGLARGIVTLDWENVFIDSLPDAGTELAFFASACMTIRQNLPQAESFHFKRNGLPYQSAFIALAPDEPYEFPKLMLGDGTPEFYAAIRATIPYEGMPAYGDEFVTADMSPEVAAMVNLLVRAGLPETEFSSPAALPNELLVLRALNNLPLYTSDYSEFDEYYREQLLPLTAAVEDSNVTLREHVEIAIFEIFGNAAFEHCSADGWVWHETEGVYTPPHHGGPSLVVPVIFSMLEGPDSVLLELSYLRLGMGGYYNPETMVYIEEEDILEAAKTLPRMDVMLRKTENGYTIYSQAFAK